MVECERRGLTSASESVARLARPREHRRTHREQADLRSHRPRPSRFLCEFHVRELLARIPAGLHVETHHLDMRSEVCRAAGIVPDQSKRSLRVPERADAVAISSAQPGEFQTRGRGVFAVSSLFVVLERGLSGALRSLGEPALVERVAKFELQRGATRAVRLAPVQRALESGERVAICEYLKGGVAGQFMIVRGALRLRTSTSDRRVRPHALLYLSPRAQSLFFDGADAPRSSRVRRTPPVGSVRV